MEIPGVNGWNRIVDWLVPEACQLCGRYVAAPLCTACRSELPWIGAACPGCARPLPAEGPCGRCLRRPPPWVRATVPLAWDFPVDRLVARLKYSGALFHARLLGSLLAEAVSGRAVDVIVPVPLHRSRLVRRGYNQALEIARPVARAVGAPLSADGCRRIRATASQAGLAARARRGNVRGAFEARGDYSGLVVAVVDDVLTTGATAGALTRALVGAGASAVEVWAVARAGHAWRNV